MTATASEAPPTTGPISVRERGYVETVETWWNNALRETAPELRWPYSIEVYDSMRRQDAQVSSVLRAVTSPIMRTPWRVDPAGARDEVVEHVAGDLGLPIKDAGDEIPNTRSQRGRSRFSWVEHLRLALLMLPFGHMYFEQLYYPPELEGGQWRYHLRKLGPRIHRTIAKINVARDGGLVSIEQYAPGSGMSKTVTLPVNRLVAYVHDREGGDWLGNSLLRPAYKNWVLKDRLLRVQTMSVERNGIGIPIYKGATSDKGELEDGEEIAAGVRAGDDSGAALPNGADLELLAVKGSLPDADKPIRYHDEQIARAVLAHFLNLGTQTGSWALGSTFADFFTLSLQAEAEIVRDVATAHIVEDLVDVNYGPDELAPRIVYDEIGSRADSIVQAIATLVSADVLKPDEDLEQFVRTALGLPPRAPLDLPGGAA